MQLRLEGTVLMETVSYIRMKDGTKEDYELLERSAAPFYAQHPDRMLVALHQLDEPYSAFKITRYSHSLQTASRAISDGRDEEYVVMALLHDIGDGLAPYTHSEVIGPVLRPFVRPELTWIAAHHGLFQSYYYAHFIGQDRNARERYCDHEWYGACLEFCEAYDQESFDPAYESLDLSVFEPMVRRVFSSPRYL